MPGADIYSDIVLPRFKKASLHTVDTRFGPTSSRNSQNDILSLIPNEDITDQLVKNYWEISEIPSKQPLTTDEKAVMEWYHQTTNKTMLGSDFCSKVLTWM